METLIRDTARQLFFSYGLKSISMDDVARQCGISKKTLYLHYHDREALVDSVLRTLLEEQQAALATVRREAANAVEECALSLHEPFELWAQVNRGFYYDLEKSFPQAWKRLNTHAGKILKGAVEANLVRGLNERIYRPGLPLGFCADLRLQQLRTALAPENFGDGRSAPLPLMQSLTLFYLQSVTNEKGRKLIPNYFNENYE
ncbi:MAG: TetR/AcrR family transcriptional regulator [Chitinophagaceae bacterium]|nr:MAG: TetR/AcrR family transcriptional regulator [Chitinophagaceae bacterium]